MCETCGCGESGKFTIHNPHHSSDHTYEHNHDHHHDHDQDQYHTHEHGSEQSQDHSHMHAHVHSHEHSHEHFHEHSHGGHTEKSIELNIDILSENRRLAGMNKDHFRLENILCLNLVSSPGSGKTTILESTIRHLIAKNRISVIEGDQQTLLDAERIEKSGAPAIQINTGSGCHLDAKMVEAAVKKLNPVKDSILFIENVGNLVCPALFDLGEFKRVVVISVTEGDDKPLKYPYMFQSSHLCIINKSDLLPYVDFSIDRMKKHANSINPELEFITLSARNGEAMEEWYSWLAFQMNSLQADTLAGDFV
jgi:hydrogenase nickel incorporation protein HypB